MVTSENQTESSPEVLCEELKLDINPEFPQFTELSNLVFEFRDLFESFDGIGIKNVPDMQIVMKAGGTFRRLPSRYLSPLVLSEVIEQLHRLEELGIIQRTSSAEGSSPLVVVVKPDGSIRLAVDYRELNSNIKYTASQIPNMKSKFPLLSGQQYFAKMDNLFGYHQWRVSPDSKDLTCIATPIGTFVYNFCPFGISTAPGLYQDLMENKILHGIANVTAVVFIDDTVVFAKESELFLSNLRVMFERLRYHNVKLKPSKCHFGYSSVEFVGHIFDNNGYHLSDQRKQGILDMNKPKTLKQLRSFLGMVNFFRDFVSHLSEALVPLTDLTKGPRDNKNRELIWNEAADAAFVEVKQLISDAGCLHVIAPQGELVLFTDASEVGSGWCLMQKQEGKWKPICYGSHKWSLAAQNWAVIQKELYGIFVGITDCSSYLLGRPFTLATDHRNLVYLKTSKIPKLVRWYLALSEFQFNIVHIPGEENVVADVLSRFFKVAVVEEKEVEVNQLLKSLHNSNVGHLGVSRLVKALKQSGIEWSGMQKDVEEFVSQCPICQKLKLKKQPVVLTEGYTLTSSGPMDCISVDSIGPLSEDDYGNKYILHFMCAFSKFNMLIPTKNVDALSYVHSLMLWIGLFGVPSRVRTDGGTQFTANVCGELNTLLGLDHFVIVPYHP